MSNKTPQSLPASRHAVSAGEPSSLAKVPGKANSPQEETALKKRSAPLGTRRKEEEEDIALESQEHQP